MQEAQCEVRQEWCSGAAGVSASLIPWWPLYHDVSKSSSLAYEYLLYLCMQLNEIKLEKNKFNCKHLKVAMTRSSNF